MTTCAMITMNAGKDIPGSTIKFFLERFAKHFERILVVDGKLTNEAKECYLQYKNVEPIDAKWGRNGLATSYVDQYQAFSERLDDGEWCLYLDDDELPSKELMDFFALTYYDSPENFKKQNKCDIFYLPCVLHLTEDGKQYYAAEPQPDKNFHGQWTKHILFKKTKDLTFKYFGSHVIPVFKHEEKGMYLERPYFHMKSLESFIYNDVWQAFLSPEGQQYIPVDAAQFKMFTSSYKTLQSFKEATHAGLWSEAMKRFAWQRRWSNGPVSRLSWTYFVLLGHTAPEKDEKMTWDHIKNLVLSKETMELYEKNKANGNRITI